MKKQLTQEQKVYRDNRDRKIIGLFAPTALLFLGVWMVIDPSTKKHASIEKATVSVLKDIWSLEAGIALLVLGGAWFTYAFMKLQKFRKTYGQGKI